MQLQFLVLMCLTSRGLCASIPEQMLPSAGITQLLLKLNEIYETRINVFIDVEDFSEDALEYRLLNTPAIHLQPTIENIQHFRIIENFPNNALIIVNIRMPPLDPAVAYFLPFLLKDLHELHIVFITEEDPDIWQEDLYRFCFREGFINTLLIHYYNSTMTLYSYNPYPEIHILELPQLDDYFNRWRQLHNFHHFPIRTFRDTIEPRKIQYMNRKGQLVHAGYIYNALKEFVRRHNATLKLLPQLPADRAFQMAFSLIDRREVDFACYPKEIAWKFANTVPLYLLKSYIAVPHARPIASYLYFAKPFSCTMWLAVICTLGYGMLMLYISYRCESSEFGLHLLTSWCHILFLPQPLVTVTHWQQFVIHFILILTGFILTNLYLAMLSSMLTIGLFEPQFNTLQDLVHSPYPLHVDDYYIDFLRNSVSLPAEVRNRMYYGNIHVLNAARTALNTSFMYFSYEDRMEAILYQQHLLKVPRFKIIPESFMDGLMAFPVAPSLPYLSLLNSYLRRIFEFGILSKMKTDSWRDTIDSGIFHLMISYGVDQKPFDLDFYYFAFALWSAGLTLAGISFLLEFARWRINIYR